MTRRFATACGVGTDVAGAIMAADALACELAGSLNPILERNGPSIRPTIINTRVATAHFCQRRLLA